MLAYAAHRRPARRLSARTVLLIAAGHGVLFAAVMAIRIDTTPPPEPIRTRIYKVPIDPPPPPPEPKAQPTPAPSQSNLSLPPRQIVLPMPDGPVVLPLPTPPLTGPIVGPSLLPTVVPEVAPTPPPPPPTMERTQPRLLTAPDRLRPPYPESKRRLEQETVLRLRLGIGADGRVTSVEPVGAADAEFLAAARTHLLRVWRYAPAREGERAVATSMVVTLRFELEE
jgi:protein TonB